MSVLHRIVQLTLAGLLVVAGVASQTRATETPDHEPRMVFASVMVCFATYGEKVEDYKREIREAQAAGIDGFALDIGEWSTSAMYPRRTAAIFQAAKELDSGFKLMFSLDDAVLRNTDDIKAMVRTYARHPNHFTYRGRPVVSTFGGELNVPWTNILKSLKDEGIDVFFVPFFYPRPNVSELPDLPMVKEHVAKWANTVDGMFLFGGAGTPEQLVQSNANYAKVLKANGRACMASLTPTYWGVVQSPGRRYFEMRGGEGLEMQWKGIIENQPDWVQIVTWNDFNESYLCPVANPGQYFEELKWVPRPNHEGYLELCKYFIQWYKTGTQPAIDQDSLFYFYRTHPKDAVAKPADPTKIPESFRERVSGPVTDRHGDVQDVIYITVLLTKPADLHVTSGGKTAVTRIPKGISHVRIPFAIGAQHFELTRDGRNVIALDGQAIVASPESYSFFSTTGFAHAK